MIGLSGSEGTASPSPPLPFGGAFALRQVLTQDKEEEFE